VSVYPENPGAVRVVAPAETPAAEAAEAVATAA